MGAVKAKRLIEIIDMYRAGVWDMNDKCSS